MNWFVLTESDLSQEFAMRTHILEFCQALSRRASVVLLSRTPSNKINNESGFVPISLTSRPYSPHTLSLIIDTCLAYSKLRRIHRSQPVEVLYVRATAFGIGPLIFARFFHIPAILEINGAWSEEQALSLKGFPVWKRIWVVPIQKARAASLGIACRLAPKIVVVTPQLASYLQIKGIQKGKISVAPNGVNIQLFCPRSQPAARLALGLDPSAQYIGFIGSLAAWQGVDILIESFAALTEIPAGCRRLLIVGDGPERQRLEILARSSAASERIQFAGARPYHQISDYIAACDVLVAPKQLLPSGYSSLKVLEYMACSRPVVASRAPGMEMIERVHAGLLCNPGNHLDLMQKLEQILGLPETEQSAMGQRAHDYVVAHYTWDHTVERVLTLVTQ
jgi:glycosyltransferase involved in cell wall biosynthesis